MATVKALFSIVRPGKGGKAEEIKPGQAFECSAEELVELKRHNAVTVVTADEAPIVKKSGKAAADKSDLV